MLTGCAGVSFHEQDHHDSVCTFARSSYGSRPLHARHDARSLGDGARQGAPATAPRAPAACSARGAGRPGPRPGDIPSIWPVSSAVSPTATRSTQQLALVLREVGEQLLGPFGVAAEQRALLGAERVVGPLGHLVGRHGRRARVRASRPAGGRRPCARRWRRRRPRRAARCRGSAAAPSGRRRRPPGRGPPRSGERHPAAGSAGCGSSAAPAGGHGRADRAWPARRRRRHGERGHR